MTSHWLRSATRRSSIDEEENRWQPRRAHAMERGFTATGKTPTEEEALGSQLLPGAVVHRSMAAR